MSVEWVRFGDVMELQRRRVEPELDRSYREVGVRSFGKGLFIKEPRLGSAIGDKKVYGVEPGDLVVSNVFAWEGAVAVAGNDAEGTIGSHRFMTWTPSKGIEVGYLAHFLASDAGLELLRAASPGSAGRNRTLSIKNLESIVVPLPSIDEQRRISAHLDRLGAVQVRLGPESSALVAALHNRDWGGVAVPVGHVIERVLRGEAVAPELTYDMQGVRWYGEGLFRRETRRGKDLSAKTVMRVSAGDLVYNRLFAWKQSFALATEGHEGYVSNEFPTYRIDENRVLPEFLLSALLSEEFTRQVNDASTGSTPTSRNRLKEAAFECLTVRVPDLEVQGSAVKAMRLAQRARQFDERRQQLAAALVPAARNQIFTAMR